MQHLPVVWACLLEFPLVELAYFFPLQQPSHENLLKPLSQSRKKHDSIKLLAQSKLDSVANIISQAIQDGDISSIEFHKLLQDVEKYRKLLRLILETRPRPR